MLSLRNMRVLLIVFVCAVVCGCERSKPAWSADSRSPDGRMIATAEGFDNGGFVAPGPNATFVYLNHTSGSQPRMLILAFSEGKAEPDAIQVEMHWLTPTHLQLSYKGQRTIDFQAVKYAGVDISVRQLSSQPEPANTPH